VSQAGSAAGAGQRVGVPKKADETESMTPFTQVRFRKTSLRSV